MRREISLRDLRFRQIHFVLPELGRSEQIAKERQHLIGVFFQAGERERPIGLADLAFDGCGHVFQILIKLIAGSRFCSARTQHLAGEPGQPALVGRIEQIARADQCRAADQRKLVIFQQQHFQAIGERDLGGSREP